MSEPSLYDRLGGVFAISAVVDHFSDQLFNNKRIVNGSPELKEWHTETFKQRLPGLKFMRTLWVCDIAGGPFRFHATRPGKDRLSLEQGHMEFRIPAEVFDEVAEELGRSLDHFKVPKREKDEVLAAFNLHRPEVTLGSRSPGPVKEPVLASHKRR